jgi:HJR/Mrr/RecB family endonuclease
LHNRPAVLVAMAGAMLLVLGVALDRVGTALIALSGAAFVLSGIAALGDRGARERRAYQRSGMTAVDAMTGRQFEVLLESLFANKGYRVARIGARNDVGADLLLNDAHGRMIVQVCRWNGVVHDDAVQQAIDAMTRYRAPRALVVTSSDYSQEALTVASSNGVTLWNRATLAAELTVIRGRPLQSGMRRFSSELQSGTRICLGFVAAFFVAVVALSTRARRPSPDKGLRG